MVSSRCLELRRLFFALLLSSGCSGADRVHLAPPWSGDAPALLLVLDPEGRPVGDGPLVFDGRQLTVEIEAPRGQRLLAYVFDPGFLGATPTSIADCGLTYSAVGAILPAPREEWMSSAIEGDLQAGLQWAPSTHGRVAIYSERCTPMVVDACRGIDVDSYPLATDLGDITTLAMTSVDEAFIAGSRETTSGPFLEVQRLFAARLEPLPANPGLPGRPYDLVWDHRDALLGVAGPDELIEGQIFAIDRFGVSRPMPAFNLGSRRRIGIGSDDAVFVAGEPGIYSVVVGSTVARALGGLDSPITHLAVRSGSELFVSNDLRELWRFDGAEWFREWHPEGLDTARLLDLRANQEQVVGVGVFGTVLRRDDSSRTWKHLPEPPSAPGYNLSHVALLTGGRFVVSFDAGGLAIWNGEAWCEHQQAPVGSVQVRALGASPDGRKAFAISRLPTLGLELQVVEIIQP